jgi:hypothetical protein
MNWVPMATNTNTATKRRGNQLPHAATTSTKDIVSLGMLSAGSRLL